MTSSDTATEVPAAPNIQPNQERRFVLILSLVFALVMILPYLWVWTASPLGHVWGGLIGETLDSNVHLAWARQSHDGALFFRDLFTTESFSWNEEPLFVNVLPLLWGKLALTGLPLIFWFHLTRAAAGIWTLWEFHKLAKRFLPQVSERKIALYLLAFTSGGTFLGLIIPALAQRVIFIDNPSPSQNFPTMPEAFVFSSALLFPLNIVSFGLMAFLFRKLVDSEDLFAARDAAAVFIGGLLLANIHTYDAIPVGLTLLFWMVYSLATKRKRAAAACLVILAGLALPTLYQGIVFRNSEEFRLKALTPTPAPALIHILLSLMPLLIFAVIGAFKLRGNRFLWLMAGWALITLLCVYAPVSFARKMIEGLQLPLALLAGAGFIPLWHKIPAGIGRKLAPAVVLGLMSLSPAYLVFWDLQNAAQNNAPRFWVAMPPQYLPQSSWDALRYLDKQPDKKVTVLCLPHVGAYGPRETGMTFYQGHWAETLNFTDKFKRLAGIYKARLSPQDAAKFFKENRIQYVVETYYERIWYGDSSGYATSYGLTPIWSGGTGDLKTIIYKVPTSSK